jgi:hypothetical protein
MGGKRGEKMPLIFAAKNMPHLLNLFLAGPVSCSFGKLRNKSCERGGLKSSSSWGEWNSSGSFTAFRMTATTKTTATAKITATATALSDPLQQATTPSDPLRGMTNRTATAGFADG